jgi:hypothetical protein
MEEELLGKIDRLLEHFQHLMDLLDTIASHIRPPLPLQIMAAGVIFAIFGRIPARFAAAWGHVVRWVNSVPEPADATAQRGKFVSGLACSIMWVEILLSPFKLEDTEAFRIRAEIAEGRCTTADDESKLAKTLHAATEAENVTLRVRLAAAQAERNTAQEERRKAQAELSNLKNRLDAFLGRVMQ